MGKMVVLVWVMALLAIRADSMMVDGKDGVVVPDVITTFTGDVVEDDVAWSSGSWRNSRDVHSKARPLCCHNPPARAHPYVGVGNSQNFAGINAYVTGSPHATSAIILVSDVFGYEAPIFRKLADKVAASGYFVVVPDYFYGDPYVPDKDYDVWLNKHEPEKAFEESAKIINILKSRGITSIGVGGVCWGGKSVIELDKGDDIKVAVLMHPAYVTVDDFKGVKMPIAILAAELDTITPPELVKQIEADLSEHPEVDSFVKIYPGVSHGFTVRYDEKDETAVKIAEAAHSKMLEWFNKYLK